MKTNKKENKMNGSYLNDMTDMSDTFWKMTYLDGEIEYTEFETRIDNYIRKKYEQKNDLVSVRAIQNSFSPEYPSKIRVLDALNTLDYTWIKDEDGNEQVLI